MFVLTTSSLMHTDVWQLLCFSPIENLHSASFGFIPEKKRKKKIKYSVKQLILTIHLLNEITEESGCWNLLPLGPVLWSAHAAGCPSLQLWGELSKSPWRVAQGQHTLLCWTDCQHVLHLCGCSIGRKRLRKVLLKGMDLFVPLHTQGKSHPPTFLSHDPASPFLMANASFNKTLSIVHWNN